MNYRDTGHQKNIYEFEKHTKSITYEQKLKFFLSLSKRKLAFFANTAVYDDIIFDMIRSSPKCLQILKSKIAFSLLPTQDRLSKYPSQERIKTLSHTFSAEMLVKVPSNQGLV